jgi:hypothetical protein
MAQRACILRGRANGASNAINGMILPHRVFYAGRGEPNCSLHLRGAAGKGFDQIGE